MAEPVTQSGSQVADAGWHWEPRRSSLQASFRTPPPVRAQRLASYHACSRSHSPTWPHDRVHPLDRAGVRQPASLRATREALGQVGGPPAPGPSRSLETEEQGRRQPQGRAVAQAVAGVRHKSI